MTETILSYYRNALLFDENIKLRIADQSLFYGDIPIPSTFDYLGYGISNFFAEDFFVKFIEESINTYHTTLEKNKNAEYPYEFFYCPFLVSTVGIDPKSKKEIKINYPIVMVPIQYKDILKIIEFLKPISEENDGTDSANVENKKKNEPLLKSTIDVHPLSFSAPFHCVDPKIQIDFLKNLSDMSMNDNALNFDQLMFKLTIFIKSLIGIEPQSNKDKSETISILERNKELIEILKAYYENNQNFENVEVFSEPWIVVKSSKEENFIFGLIKVYDSINKNKLSKDNLLHAFFKGNKYKKSVVSFDKEVEDASTIILTKAKLAEYLCEQKGALAKSNDLTYSQRFALAMYKRNLKTTVVNGPPGTGKTALLRALVAETTIENALRVYKAFEAGEKSFPFATPIVSFSTNNAALVNITEGINSAFLEIKKAVISSNEVKDDADKADESFYERWLNIPFEFSKGKETISGNINDNLLYVPFIKNTKHDFQKENIPLYSFNIKDSRGLQSFIYKLGNQFHTYLNMWMEKYLEFVKDVWQKEEIILAQPEIHLDAAIKDLKRRLDKNFTLLDEKKDEVLQYIRDKKEYKNDLEKVCETLSLKMPTRPIQNKKSFDIEIKKIECQLLHIQNNLTHYDEQYRKKDDEKREKLNDHDKHFISLSEEINQKSDQKTREKLEESESKLTNLRQQFQENIQRISDNLNTLKEQIISSFWGRIKFFLSTSFKLEKFRDKRFIEYDKQRTIFNEIYVRDEKYIKELLRIELEEIEQNRAFHMKELQEKMHQDKEEIKKTFTEEFTKLKQSFSDYCFGKSVNEAKDIIKKSTLPLERLKRENYFFIDEFEEKFMEIYKGVDTSIRTDNFFYATHLLEGLLLYELQKSSDLKSNLNQKCFACGKGTIQISSKSNSSTYKCNQCGAVFYNQKSNLLNRPLNASEVATLLANGYVEINGDVYTLVQNQTDGKTQFWNLHKGMGMPIGNPQKMFRYASVLFPIVNTTCHSFGSVFNINKDNDSVPESFIDTLFMDESGMILTPYLVNLYAGKRVILFGDEKQIPPVYPFGEYKNVCNDTLIRVFAKDEEEINRLETEYSVIAQNAMSLANVSVYIKNPYVYNPLQGDIWLREHFRCKTPIIEFCNKHIYNNFMKLCNAPEKGMENRHLFAYNHEYNSTKFEGGGCTNKEEALFIIEEIKNCLEKLGGNTPENCAKIGIITPYNKQENLLKDLLEKRKMGNILAGTVHKFQGSEREYIYFSSTVGPNDDNVANAFFNTDDFNIINVAVSRAKKAFLLVGNNEKIRNAATSYIGKLLLHIDEKGCKKKQIKVAEGVVEIV